MKKIITTLLILLPLFSLSQDLLETLGQDPEIKRSFTNIDRLGNIVLGTSVYTYFTAVKKVPGSKNQYSFDVTHGFSLKRQTPYHVNAILEGPMLEVQSVQMSFREVYDGHPVMDLFLYILGTYKDYEYYTIKSPLKPGEKGLELQASKRDQHCYIWQTEETFLKVVFRPMPLSDKLMSYWTVGYNKHLTR